VTEIAVLVCKSCGGQLDLTMSACPSCGAAVELARLTGILGIVCRACDAYNEPGSRSCSACGAPVGDLAEPPRPVAAMTPASATPVTSPPASMPPAPGQPVLRAFQRGAAVPTRVVPLVPSLSPPAGQLPAVPPPAQAPPPAPPPRPLRADGPLHPGRAMLVVERGVGLDGVTFQLHRESVGAGRTQGAVIFPDDPCLAPLHATFFYRGGSLHLRDEGAPGGVYLRLRGPSVPLRPGDLFAVGDRLLRFAGGLPPSPPGPPDGTRRLGAPRPPSPTVVIEELLEGGATGRVFVRGGGSVTIGRSGCAVNLGDDPDLSQAHAELVVDSAGGARLKDLGSSNGTFVRVPPHAERELQDGDWLRLGREVLRVEVSR
jgi:pSer/pThr/pTyr-binding forkhead associated (FHA) protein